MTPLEIVEAAQNNLNAVSDTLWSQTEILNILYMVELQLARKTRCIEATSTQTSTAGTADYSKPTSAQDILRVTYNGTKLQKISQEQFDQLNPTGLAQSGTPVYYTFFNDTFTLSPTPDTSALVIKTWSYNEPVKAGATDTLSTPSRYHDVLVNGVTYGMCPKDLGHPLTTFWRDKWFTGMAEVEWHVRIRRRADGFGRVSREEDALTTNFGII